MRRPVRLSGIGIHTGQPASVAVLPADAGRGIVIRPAGAGPEAEVPADVAHIGGTDHCTTLVGDGWSVATVEHLLAALSGLEINNALIEVGGPEVPALDGSAAPFAAALDEAGVVTFDTPRQAIRVLRPIRVELGPASAELSPHDGRRLEISVDYANPVVGAQRFAVDMSPELFRDEIAPARTFGFLADAQQLWCRGFALGASVKNALVVGDGHVVNPEGLRFPDEFARHKVLDALGDMALAGAPILGRLQSHRGGHALNARLMAALMAAPDAWERVELTPRTGRGAGLAAAVFHADLS